MTVLLQAAKEIGQLTHYCAEGYNGGILISYAVHLALNSSNEKPLEPLTFIDQLIKFAESVLEEYECHFCIIISLLIN